MFGVSFYQERLFTSFRLLLLKQMERVTRIGRVVMGKREEKGKITRALPCLFLTQSLVSKIKAIAFAHPDDLKKHMPKHY